MYGRIAGASVVRKSEGKESLRNRWPVPQTRETGRHETPFLQSSCGEDRNYLDKENEKMPGGGPHSSAFATRLKTERKEEGHMEKKVDLSS